MAYTKTNWQDLPNTTTPITAARLNNIEDGIKTNDDKLLGNTSMGDISVNSITMANRDFISQNSPTYLQGNDGDIETKKALANWNGAYDSSNNSNLKYCVDGDILSSEIGTSGIWTYMKFNNDYAICWGKQTINTKINEAWGSLYTSGEKDLDDFPFIFVSTPTIQTTMSCSDRAAFIGSASNAATVTSTTNPGSVNILRGTAMSTNSDYIINIIAIGKWR